MVDYIINPHGKRCTYRIGTGIITIGAFSFDNLTDSEVIEFMSDSLTHEHIHRVLDRLFDGITTTLFDGIEYLFRNEELHIKHLKGTSGFTYQTNIKKYGYKDFLDNCGLTEYNVLGANILCNDRKEKDECCNMEVYNGM